jgi:hypothetical protein
MGGLSLGLRRRIRAVAWRVRLLRGLRALCWLVLLLVGSGTVALLIDHHAQLPPGVRQGLLAVWLGVAGLGLLGWLAAVARRIAPKAVAARIEKCYPQLGERLTSAVELGSAGTKAHGSPAFIALLVEEAEKHSEGLPFARAVPAGRTKALAALAALVVLLAVSPALVWPGEFERLRGRFLHPWDEVGPVEEADVTPEVPASKPTPRRVPRVELAPESPTITVTPPAYARSAIELSTLHGLVDVAALQHSEVHFDFAFTRLAVAARLEWRKGRRPQSIQELKLSGDRCRASGTRRTEASAGYRLVVEGEQGGRVELPGGKLIVKPDQPPVFVSVEAGENLPYVVAHDRLPLAVVVSDDVGVAKVELEYRAEDGPITREGVALRGANTRRAQGRHVFELAGKVGARQHLYYRLRAEDNLPAEYGGPHVVTHPADGWLMLRVADEGQTLREKAIAVRRDELRRQLARLKDNLASEQRGIYRMDRETADSDKLTAEQKQRLDQLRRDNQEARQALEKLGEQAGKAPVLEDLADKAAEAAQEPLQASQKALDRAADQEPQERHEALRKADQEVGKALDQLDELRKLNEKRAAERLEQAKLEALADREKRLAEELRKLAGKDEVPEDRLEQLRRDQARTAREVEQLARRNKQLGKEPEASPPEKARELADRAEELSRRQRELAGAQDGKGETTDRPQPNPAGELVRRQKELARQAQDLTRQVEQEQGGQAPAAEQARKVEQALRQAARQMQAGALPEANKIGKEAAQQLRRLAEKLAGARPPGGDPQTADALQQARQLEQKQAEQNRRLEPLAGREDVQKAQRQQEQRALQQQTKQLAQELNRRADETPGSAGSALEQAGQQATKAEQTMRQAQAQPGRRGQMQQEAARLLEQAGQQARQAAGKERAQSDAGEGQQPGKAIRQARRHMEQADRQLEREQPVDAAPLLDRAAEALQQAARQMAQAGKPQPGSMRPTGLGGQTPPADGSTATAPGGRPDSRPIVRQPSPPGKTWGELPGELRTRIMQEMKAQYGDDYAQRIKLYFEQIASTDPLEVPPLPPSSAPRGK